jgi:hypothetical protein
MTSQDEYPYRDSLQILVHGWPKIVTLFDMLKVAASDWNEIMRLLDSFEFAPLKPVTLLLDTPKAEIVAAVERIHALCVSLYLPQSSKYAHRLLTEIKEKQLVAEAAAELHRQIEAGDFDHIKGATDNILAPKDLEQRVFLLRERIDDELDSLNFFILEFSHREYLEDDEQFGSAVKLAFPDTTWDIREANQCFAFERYTACGYHLMRVLDHGLKEIALRFDVTYDHRNWENVLKDIKTANDKMHENPKWNCYANWRDHHEFYAKAIGYLNIEKIGWRNPLAHSRITLYQPDAELVMANVRAFMVQLSQKQPDKILKEIHE